MVKRHTAAAFLLLFATSIPACKKEEQATTAPSAASATSPTATAGPPVDVASKVTLKDADKDIYAVCFGEGGKSLFTGMMNGPVIVWDAASGTQKGPTTENDSFVNLQLSPDQKTVAASGQFNTVKLLDATSGKELRSLPGHPSASGSLLGIEALAWSPDGTRLASAKGREIKVWDVAAGKEAATFKAPDKISGVTCLAFSVDGKRLAGGGNASGASTDGAIYVWDVDGGLKTTIPMPSGSIHWVLFLDDKTVIAANGFMGASALDIATGNAVRKFTTDYETVVRGAISPDRKRLATVSAKGTVQYWDVDNGNVVANLKGIANMTLHGSVAFAPDGKSVAAAADGKTACIWQVPLPQ